LSNAQELSSFFLNKGFLLVSRLIASYLGASKTDLNKRRFHDFGGRKNGQRVMMDG
jgi:hypothetical protein